MLNVFHAKKILCFKDSFSKLALLASMDYTYIYIFYIFLYFFLHFCTALFLGPSQQPLNQL